MYIQHLERMEWLPRFINEGKYAKRSRTNYCRTVNQWRRTPGALLMNCAERLARFLQLPFEFSNSLWIAGGGALDKRHFYAIDG